MNSPSSIVFRVFFPDGREQVMDRSELEATIAQLKAKDAEIWTDSLYINEFNDQAWISLFWAQEQKGCIVSCCGASDTCEYFAATNSGNDSEMIRVRKGGSIEAFPRNYFISRSLAFELLSGFVATMDRSTNCEWVAVGDQLSA